MRTTRHPRGAGLLEAVIAMGVVMIGAAGVIGLSRQSTHFMADSRKTVRATAFAQDLVNQIELWDFDDPRLANAISTNDAVLGDPDYAFATTQPPDAEFRDAVKDGLADHGEDDLKLGGKEWAGLPVDLLRANEMQRYWNVAYEDDYNGNGVPDAIRVAVIIRWPVRVGDGEMAGKGPVGWNRVVLTTTKINPGDLR